MRREWEPEELMADAARRRFAKGLSFRSGG
jgi:hypothetical protein